MTNPVSVRATDRAMAPVRVPQLQGAGDAGDEMNPCEALAIQALSRVTFVPGTPAKRFARNMAAMPEDYELSDRQRWYLAYLCWRFRRQLPRTVSDWALEASAGSPAPPPTKAAKVAVERKTKADVAREVLKRPLKFGDVEQAKANRMLAPKWRMI